MIIPSSVNLMGMEDLFDDVPETSDPSLAASSSGSDASSQQDHRLGNGQRPGGTAAATKVSCRS